MDNEKKRKLMDFLSKIGGFTHLGVIGDTKHISFGRIEKIEDWEKVPNFFSVPPERSDLMKQLTVCILQLQAEVDRLRRGQE